MMGLNEWEVLINNHLPMLWLFSALVSLLFLCYRAHQGDDIFWLMMAIPFLTGFVALAIAGLPVTIIMLVGSFSVYYLFKFLKNKGGK